MSSSLPPNRPPPPKPPQTLQQHGRTASSASLGLPLPATVAEMEAQVRIASETLAENARLFEEIHAALSGVIAAEVSRVGAAAQLRSALQSLSHALQSDPQQRWRPARRSVENLSALEQQLQSVTQSYVRELEERALSPLRLVVEEELRAPVKSARVFAAAAARLSAADAVVAGENALRIFAAANEGINRHTRWLLETLHRTHRKYFQSGLASLCAAVEPPTTATATAAHPLAPQTPPPRSASMSAQVSPLSPAMRLRQLRPSAAAKAVAELQDLLRSHVSSLDQLMDLLQGLRRGAQLTSDDEEALFGPTPAIFSLHTRSLTHIEKLMRPGSAPATDRALVDEVVSLVAEALPAMKKDYVAFVRSEAAALLAFSRLRKTPAFAAVAHLPPQFDFLHIRTGALAHLREYEPLLSAVIAGAGVGNARTKADEDLLSGLKALVEKVEVAKSVSDRSVPLLRLKERLFGFNDIADSDTRTFELDSPAVIVSAPLAKQLLPPPRPQQSLALPSPHGRSAAVASSAAAQQKYHFYLFSDCWCLAAVETDEVHRVVYRGQLLRLQVLAPHPQGLALRLSWSQSGDTDEDHPQHTTDIALITARQSEADGVRETIVRAIEARAQTQVFGIDLMALALRHGGNPPPLVQQLADIIVARGGLQAVGIFRVSVGKQDLQRLRSVLDSGAPSIEIADPMMAAALLRLWLRCLPSPLLGFDLYDAWLRAGELSGEEQIMQLRSLLAQLPDPNRIVTGQLMSLLAKIVAESSTNMMSATNLAIVLAPSLLRARQADLDSVAIALETSRLFRPVEALILNYLPVFVAP